MRWEWWPKLANSMLVSVKYLTNGGKTSLPEQEHMLGYGNNTSCLRRKSIQKTHFTSQSSMCPGAKRVFLFASNKKPQNMPLAISTLASSICGRKKDATAKNDQSLSSMQVRLQQKETGQAPLAEKQVKTNHTSLPQIFLFCFYYHLAQFPVFCH